MYRITVLNRDMLFETFVVNVPEQDLNDKLNELLDQYKMSDFQIKNNSTIVYVSNGYLLTVTKTHD